MYAKERARGPRRHRGRAGGAAREGWRERCSVRGTYVCTNFIHHQFINNFIICVPKFVRNLVPNFVRILSHEMSEILSQIMSEILFPIFSERLVPNMYKNQVHPKSQFIIWGCWTQPLIPSQRGTCLPAARTQDLRCLVANLRLRGRGEGVRNWQLCYVGNNFGTSGLLSREFNEMA